MNLADQLLDAIAASGQSVNRIARETGIPQQVLQRFVAGTRANIRIDTASKLADYFDLELRKRKGRHA